MSRPAFAAVCGRSAGWTTILLGHPVTVLENVKPQ
jgi:hypothetical protein